jgi:hypothetical protein
MKRCLYLSRAGLIYGPYAISSVHRFVEDGDCDPTDGAWIAGMEKWGTLEEVFRQLENQSEVGVDALVGESPLEQAEKIWKLVEKDQLNLAIDLHLALNDPAVTEAILERVGLSKEVHLVSNVDVPQEVYFEHGIFLFLSCLSKLAEVNRIPERFLRLKEFRLSHYFPLSSLEPIKSLPCLESLTLDFSEAGEIEDLCFFEEFPNLRDLKISDFDGEDFGFLSKLPNLTSLTLENCENLREAPRLACKEILRTASFSGCANLRSIEGLKEARSLEKLDLFGCEVLSDLSPLENCIELATLDLRCCSSLREEGPLAHMEVEDLLLGGCPLLFTYMGRKLRSSPLSSLSMVWDGSGDDGWYEGTAYDREGREVEGEEASELLAMVEDFVCMKLPGGAGNDAGSYGLMEVDVSKGQATWEFHWRDGLQTFRERVREWTKFDRLKLVFGFVVRIREDQTPNANYWSDVGTQWDYCFDEYDGGLSMSLKEASACRNGHWEVVPIKDLSGVEDLLEQWKSDTYYNEVEDMLKRLYNGCKGDLPDYLLERDLVVEFDLKGNEVEFSHDCNSMRIDLELAQEREIFPLGQVPAEE